ncbi:hypothetical protein C8F04DRAFT_1181914 [Mycena alexandri]|uniref:Secreted protein n=1 Tax=Mycena alexandri TaxID=1745969 RepID=A0AAD6SYP4_9AGAR|nr:hypothetical protein C8F04DRAFT_1181914 [Mycena alexandri]
MLTAYVTSFAAIVLSFVVHVHATVSATVPISFPCAAYQPSTEHGVTHSHPRFMVVGALSLMFVVSALALRRANHDAYEPQSCTTHHIRFLHPFRGALYTAHYIRFLHPFPRCNNSRNRSPYHSAEEMGVASGCSDIFQDSKPTHDHASQKEKQGPNFNLQVDAVHGVQLHQMTVVEE